MYSKTWLVLCLMICMANQSLISCDICGCNLGNHGVGLMHAFNSNQISLRYSLNSFKSSQETDNRVGDRFNTFEISFSYFLTSKLKLMAYVPYQLNERTLNGQQQQIQGIGDVRLSISQTIFDKVKLGEQTTLQVEAGAAVIFPSGNYKESIHDLELPENFNLGRGGFGLGFTPQLVLNHKNTGVLWSANYQYQFKSVSGYHFGNQFSSQLLAFYEKNFSENTKWIPFSGVHVEWAQNDQYANDVVVHGTGAKALYIAAGMNLKWKSFMTGLSLALPVFQNYSGGETISRQKLSCQVFYFFN